MLRRIRREAGRLGSDSFGRLAAEAWLRRWLSLNRIPSWCNPSPPGSPGRYGIILRCGTRILVEPVHDRSSPDRAAEACCGLTASVTVCDGSGTGKFHGWRTLAELCRSGSAGSMRPPEELPGYVGVSRRFLAEYILGTASLLVFGEPDPPARDLDGVPRYNPGLSGTRGGPGFER